MDVVDAQYHLGPGAVDATLAAMDAAGIASVLLDEYWFAASDYEAGALNPGYRLASGAWRTVSPTAELASFLHPERFSYLVRIDRTDPELEHVMRVHGTTPSVRAFRVLATQTPDEAEVFANDGYRELFELATDIGLPVCLFMPGAAHLLPPYLAQHPDVTFVVDHCGMLRPGMRQTVASAGSPDGAFDEVLKLAAYPNVVLKWSHAQYNFDAPTYPYEPVRPYLRRAIEAFGADRLLWTSDASVMFDHTWSDLLYSLRDDPELSQDEKEWILGRAARRVFNWPLVSR